MNIPESKTTQVAQCHGLRTRIDVGPGGTLLVLDGEIDLFAGPTLCAALDRALEQPVPQIVIDVNGLVFCDCSGVREFARAARTAQRLGGRLLLVGADGQLRRIIELTGARELLGGTRDAVRLGARLP